MHMLLSADTNQYEVGQYVVTLDFCARPINVFAYLVKLGRLYGEVTSQNLWSRYDRHFVGITRHNALS